MPTFTIADHAALDIELDSGHLEIIAVPGSALEVTLHPTHPGDDDAAEVARNTRIDQQGSTVVVRVPRVPRRLLGRSSSDLTVIARVPVGTDLLAVLNSADVRADGELGAVSIRSGSGDCQLADVSRDATIESGSGDVTVAMIGGDARVKTGSGDITIDTACGACSVQSGSGDIVVDASEDELVAQTASGDVRIRETSAVATIKTASGDVDVSRATAGRVDVTTASGDVSIGVQRGVVVWVEASSLTGDVVSGLESTELDGDAEGSLELRAHSTTGDIHLTSA